MTYNDPKDLLLENQIQGQAGNSHRHLSFMDIGVGLFIITGPAGGGKSVYVQNTDFRRSHMFSKIKYTELTEIHSRLGHLALEVPEFVDVLFGIVVDDLKFSDAESGSLSLAAKRRKIAEHSRDIGMKISKVLDSDDFFRKSVYVFTEADEYGVDADIIIDTFAPDFSDLPMTTAVCNGEDVIIENVAAAIQLASIVCPVRISSATPSVLVYSKLPNASVKGGLNAGFIDSLNLLNKDLIKIGGTVIAEVRDDWGDSEENQKISGAGRMYGVANNLVLSDVRVRNVPGVFATDSRHEIEDKMVKCMEEVSEQINGNNGSQKENGLFFNGEVIFGGSGHVRRAGSELASDASRWQKS